MLTLNVEIELDFCKLYGFKNDKNRAGQCMEMDQ